MLTSPVLRYELLTIGRRRRYFLLRGVYVVGLLFALWLCYLEAFGWYGWNRRSLITAYAYLAEYFFAAFSGIQLGAILLLTPATTAGTIAGEHERRTIDYLLTTHLTDGEITLCKFAARMLTLAYQLLVGLPVLALVMLFGGIDPLTLVKVFGYSALVLVGTASLSLWISASCRTTRVAVTSAYLAVIVLVGLPLICWLGMVEELRLRSGPVFEAVTAWNLWSPVMLLVGAFDGALPAQAMHWHRPEYIVPLYLTVSVVWLGLAVRALRRTHVRTGAVGRRWFWSRREKPPRTIGHYAMLWKETICQRGVLRLGWIGRGATIVLFTSAYAALAFAIWHTWERDSYYRNAPYRLWSDDKDPFGYGMPFHYTALHTMACSLDAIVGSFVLLLVAARAAGSATCEKEQDSWFTLLSTPLTAAEIVFAKIGGALYSVRYWYLFLVVVWVCCGVRFPYQFAFAPVLFVEHLLMAWLCAAVGLFFSLRFKSSLWAIGATVGLLTIVLGAVPLLIVFFLDLLDRGGAQPELLVVGFIAPMIFGGTEHLFVRWLCGAYSYRNEDGQIAASVGTALFVYGLAAAALTSGLVFRFSTWTGRLDGDDSSIVPVATPNANLSTEAAK